MLKKVWLCCHQNLNTPFISQTVNGVVMLKMVWLCSSISQLSQQLTLSSINFLINRLSHKSTFSSINFLINQLYSSLAQLIATFKTFRLVFFVLFSFLVFWKTGIFTNMLWLLLEKIDFHTFYSSYFEGFFSLSYFVHLQTFKIYVWVFSDVWFVERSTNF